MDAERSDRPGFEPDLSEVTPAPEGLSLRVSASPVSSQYAARAGVLARRPAWRLSMRRQEALVGVLFVAPQVIGFLVLVAGPLVAIGYFSFFRWNIIQGTLRFIG